MQAASQTGRSRGMVVISAEDCKGCSLCVEVCPPQVLRISEVLNRMGYHPVEYLGSDCTGCGVCFYVCPEPSAITVYKRVHATPAAVTSDSR